jgi:hypothetical protein
MDVKFCTSDQTLGKALAKGLQNYIHMAVRHNQEHKMMEFAAGIPCDDNKKHPHALSRRDKSRPNDNVLWATITTETKWGSVKEAHIKEGERTRDREGDG